MRHIVRLGNYIEDMFVGTLVRVVLISIWCQIGVGQEITGLISTTGFVDAHHRPGENASWVRKLDLPVPKMVYPANGVTGIPVVPKFIIRTVADADRYELRIALDEYFWNEVSYSYWQFTSPTNGDSALEWFPAIRTVESLKNSTTYFWCVRALGSNGSQSSPWSSAFQYTTMLSGPPIAQPALISPENNVVIPWLNIPLQWTQTSDASWYQVQWGTSSSFSSFSYMWTLADSPSLKVNAKPLTRYYWRVTAFSDGSLSPFSETRVFDTGNLVTVTDSEGTFEDGSGSDDYDNNLDLYWLIKPPSARQITLSFTSFNTEANYDYVTIYDGPGTNARVLGRFSGDILPPSVTSSQGVMLVEFTTDWWTTVAGWTAKYHSDASTLTIGSRIKAAGTGANVRSEQLTDILFTQDGGVHGTITGGPVNGTAGGFTGSWWRIDWDSEPPDQNRVQGWSAESVISSAPSAGDVPRPDFSGSCYTGENIFWQSGFAPASTNPPNPQLSSALGNCTWYAHGRLRELGYNETQMNVLHGNASEWDNEAVMNSISVDGTPTTGSIAQTDSGAGGLGHVAVVEAVNDDGTITVTESSYSTSLSSTSNFVWRHRTVSPRWFQNFIHVSKLAPTSVERVEIPTIFSLCQNYPNPFNPATTIQFALPKSGWATLKVFDILGKEVAILVSEELGAGYYSVRWQASVPSGIYFYRLQAGEFVETKRMVLLK